MFKYYSIVTSILFLLLISSCSSKDDIEFGLTSECQSEDIILQERSNKLPIPISLPFTAQSKSMTRSLDAEGGIIGNSDVLLGYSYSVGNSIFGDLVNVKFPVIDLAKVKAKGDSYITPKRLNSNTTYVFSYNGLLKYESNSQISKSVKTGFNLSIGLFKIGRESMLSEKFSSSFNYGTNVVFGELNIEVRGSQFELNCTPEKLRVYAGQCLSSTFQTDLYRGTIGGIISRYGPFVLRSYITGAKATALYAGKSSSELSSSSKENSLNKDINASFSWEKNSVSGSLSFGNGSNSGNSRNLETQNTEVYVQTYGGKPEHQVILGPQELAKLSLDLTPWLQSTKDRNLHTIIDITSGLTDSERGLYPMSDFVLEKNFKYRLDDTTLGFLESLDEIQSPKIEIVKVFARHAKNGENLYEIATVLTTRQGDKIVLSNGEYKTMPDDALKANNDNQIMKAKVQEIFKQKKNIFQDIDFYTNYTTTYNPDIRKPLCLRLDGFKEGDMALHIDPKTNMRYIYNSKTKIALSYMFDEEYEDVVLDYYGIREWVESLPQKKVSILLLQTSYTIIGL